MGGGLRMQVQAARRASTGLYGMLQRSGLRASTAGAVEVHVQPPM
jgi:hypothetical protein